MKPSPASSPDAVVISDLHLGSFLARPQEIIAFLDTLDPDTALYINGDILHEPSYHKVIKNGHAAVLEHIARRANTFVTKGNHDVDIDLLQNLLDKEVAEEYTIESGDKRFLLTHGDTFDIFCDNKKNSLRRKLGNGIHHSATFMMRTERPVLSLRKRVEHIVRSLFPTKDRAVAHALAGSYDGIIIGHTHWAEIDYHNETAYANSGAWIKNYPCTYLTIDNGVVTLHTHASAHS